MSLQYNPVTVSVSENGVNGQCTLYTLIPGPVRVRGRVMSQCSTAYVAM